MAKATSGPLPFREAYPDFAARSRSKKNLSENWALGGWREKPQKPAMRKIMSSLGNEYQMPGEDLDKFVQYVKHESENSSEYSEADKKLLKHVQTPADYIDFAFDEQRLKRLKRQQVTEMEATEGHIRYMWYNSRYMLFKVKFWNGTICCFFNVPARVVALLFSYAEHNTLAPRSAKNGKPRHALGVEFWNLIRVRGTQHATRYPFEYTNNENAGPRERKWTVISRWNERLGRMVQSRIKTEDIEGKDEWERERDKKFMEAINAEDAAQDALDRIYDYEDEDLVTFFENGAYDDFLGKANPAQRGLLQRALSLYDNDQDIGSIETLLRNTGMTFPEISELHAKYD